MTRGTRGDGGDSGVDQNQAGARTAQDGQLPDFSPFGPQPLLKVVDFRPSLVPSLRKSVFGAFGI